MDFLHCAAMDFLHCAAIDFLHCAAIDFLHCAAMDFLHCAFYDSRITIHQHNKFALFYFRHILPNQNVLYRPSL